MPLVRGGVTPTVFPRILEHATISERSLAQYFTDFSIFYLIL